MVTDLELHCRLFGWHGHTVLGNLLPAGFCRGELAVSVLPSSSHDSLCVHTYLLF